VTALNYASLLSSINLRAVLRVIRAGESWNDHTDPERDALAYRVRYHPKTFPTLFDSFDQHPRVFEPLPDGSGRRSSAAGAYQIIATTWDSLQSKYGLGPRFDPYEQDCAAVALIYDAGALEDALAGRLDQVIAKCGKVWASLPGSSLHDGGGKMTRARAEQVYIDWHGALARQDQIPAPIEDRSTQARPEDAERINDQEITTMGPLAFLLPLIQSLASVFAPFAQAKLSEALNKTTKDPVISGQMAVQIIDIVKQAANATGLMPPTAIPTHPITPSQMTLTVEQMAEAVQAVAAVKGNPKAVESAQAQVVDYLDRLLPLVDRVDKMEQAAWAASESSANAAAARHAALPPDAWDMTRLLVIGMLAMMGFLLLFVAGIAGWQTYQSNAPTTEVWASITGLIGFSTGIAVTVYAFRFGYSRQSGAKDALLSELATRR
jgi:muramidase (phage lysozyme)